MAIQLPRRRDVRPSRKYAQPITRQMIKPVPGRRDPGARGGPSAAATPLAFGGGAGLAEAGKQLMALGEEWAKEEAIAQAQRDALFQEKVLMYTIHKLKEMQLKPPTARTANTTPLQLGGLPSSGGGYQGPMTKGGNIPESKMKAGKIPWNE